jgi:hypothetical protein
MAVLLHPDVVTMDKQSKFTREVFLYSLILMLAFALRLALLRRVPLVDSEASLAYQAWRVWQGDVLALGSQTAYLSITGGLFSIFGSGDFLARFWPALSGGLLVLVPFLARERVGKVPALVLAGGLALDPALVSVSRIAGGPMPALVFLFLALTAFDRKELPWALFLIFLAMFSGPAFWLGATILGITILICAWMRLIDPVSYIRERLELVSGKRQTDHYSPEDFLLPGLLILVVGSFFFTRIQGLGAWPGSLAEFLITWISPTSFKSLQVLLHLGVSSPLILIFGGLGFYTSWRLGERLGKISTVWFGISLLLLLLFPGRQAVDLIWLAIPLWIGTARELVRIYQLVEGSWPIWVLAGLIGVLLALNWLTVTGMVFQIGNQRALLLQLGLLAASLALVLLALTITASEWGWPTAKKGLTLGAAGMLLMYTISATAQGAYLKAGDPRSLWSDGSGPGQMNLLLETVGEISISQTGRRDSIQGYVIHGNDTLRWALKGLKGIEFFDAYHPDNLPPILITPEEDQDLVPQNSYRGQDFVMRTRPGWPELIPDDWISWIAFRKGPLVNEKVILWVRSDILAGNE